MKYYSESSNIAWSIAAIKPTSSASKNSSNCPVSESSELASGSSKPPDWHQWNGGASCNSRARTWSQIWQCCHNGKGAHTLGMDIPDTVRTWTMYFVHTIIQSYSWCILRSAKYETSSSSDPPNTLFAAEYSSANHVQRFACSALHHSNSW